MKFPDTPLSPEALRFRERIFARIDERLAEVNRTPAGILLWGPGLDSTNPLAAVRLNLRSRLRQIGHAAFYSEELCDPSKPFSVRLQQLAQAQDFDLIVSLPCTPGSLAEVHDFAADRRVHAKLLIFLNELHLPGYSAQSLQALSSLLSCHLQYYPNEDETDVIELRTLAEAQKIRELKYILAGRY
jgi:hypothetical protein